VRTHSKVPTFEEWQKPSSSALMISSFASLRYPSLSARLLLTA